MYFKEQWRCASEKSSRVTDKPRFHSGPSRKILKTTLERKIQTLVCSVCHRTRINYYSENKLEVRALGLLPLVQCGLYRLSRRESTVGVHNP